MPGFGNSLLGDERKSQRLKLSHSLFFAILPVIGFGLLDYHSSSHSIDYCY